MTILHQLLMIFLLMFAVLIPFGVFILAMSRKIANESRASDGFGVKKPRTPAPYYGENIGIVRFWTLHGICHRIG